MVTPNRGASSVRSVRTVGYVDTTSGSSITKSDKDRESLLLLVIGVEGEHFER